MSETTPHIAARLGRRSAAAFLGLALLTLLGAATGNVSVALRLFDAPEPRDVTVELRSWVVMGRGRHLYAQIFPPGARRNGAEVNGSERRAATNAAWPADLPLIVEYWSVAVRDGYAPPSDEARAERIARMPLGHRVTPALVTPPDNRLEATYRVTLRQAKELARDRVFANRYFLLGPNSSSGLRAAMEQAGLRLPPRVTLSAGPLGEFPGIDLSPGREAPRARWAEFGLPSK